MFLSSLLLSLFPVCRVDAGELLPVDGRLVPASVHLLIYQQLQQLTLPETCSLEQSSALPGQAVRYGMAGGTARPSQYKSSPRHLSPPN
jgi:hypothetical protein